jgi:hypothetical protein
METTCQSTQLLNLVERHVRADLVLRASVQRRQLVEHCRPGVRDVFFGSVKRARSKRLTRNSSSN